MGLKSFKYKIKDADGIHARPAGLLVREAGKFSSEIFIEKEGKKGDAKGIFSVMGLSVKCGDEVLVTIEGDDEDQAFSVLESFFKENF